MVQTIRLDEIIEEVYEHPENYRNGVNLTAEEKRVIKPEDTWEVSFIAKIPDETARVLDRAFYFLNPIHYQELQKKEWGEKQRDLLRHRLGREPTSLELIDDAEKNKNYPRYRLCYILNYPQNVAIRVDVYPFCEDIVGWFLANACRLNPINAGKLKPQLDYFEVLEGNTILRG